MGDEFEQLPPAARAVLEAFLAKSLAGRNPAARSASEAMAEAGGEPHPYSLRMSRHDRDRLERLATGLGLKSSVLARRLMVEGLDRYEAMSQGKAPDPQQAFQRRVEHELVELRHSQAAILEILQAVIKP